VKREVDAICQKSKKKNKKKHFAPKYSSMTLFTLVNTREVY